MKKYLIIVTVIFLALVNNSQIIPSEEKVIQRSTREAKGDEVNNVSVLNPTSQEALLVKNIVLATFKSVNMTEIEELFGTSVQLMINFVGNTIQRVLSLLSAEEKKRVYEVLLPLNELGNYVTTLANKDFNNKYVKEEFYRAFAEFCIKGGTLFQVLYGEDYKEALKSIQTEQAAFSNQMEIAIFRAVSKGLLPLKDVTEKMLYACNPASE